MLWRYSQNIVFHYNTNAIAFIKNLWRQSWSVYDVIREYQIRGFSHPDKHLHWQNINSVILKITPGIFQCSYDIQFKGDRQQILQLLEISMSYLFNCRMPKMLLGNSTLQNISEGATRYISFSKNIFYFSSLNQLMFTFSFWLYLIKSLAEENAV